MSSTTFEVARWFPFIPGAAIISGTRADSSKSVIFCQDQTMLAKLIAMIAHEDDDGTAAESKPVDRIDDLADLPPVHE